MRQSTSVGAQHAAHSRTTLEAPEPRGPFWMQLLRHAWGLCATLLATHAGAARLGQREGWLLMGVAPPALMPAFPLIA